MMTRLYSGGIMTRDAQRYTVADPASIATLSTLSTLIGHLTGMANAVENTDNE
jgi:hypothetical protein